MNMAMYKATTQFGLRITVLVLGMFLTASAFGQGLPADIDGGDTRRAKDLLARAVAYYKEEGDVALAAISRQGRFTDGFFWLLTHCLHNTCQQVLGFALTRAGNVVSHCKNFVIDTCIEDTLFLMAPTGPVLPPIGGMVYVA